MNSDLYFEGKQFISSSRAAKISGYVNDYIGQLCRDGKLDCRMVGRTWYVSFESLISHKNSNGGASKNRSKKSLENLAPNLPVEASEISHPEISPVSNFVQPLTPFEIKKEAEVIRATTTPVPIFTTQISYPVFSDVSSNTISIPVRRVEENISVSESPVSVSYPNFSEEKMIRKLELSSNKTSSQKLFSEEKEKISSLSHTPIVSSFFSRVFPTAFALVVSFIFAFAGFLFAVRANPTAQVAYNSAFNSFRTETNVSSENLSLNLQANVFSGFRGTVDQAGLAVYHAVNNFLFDTRERILVMSGLEIEKKVSEVKQVDTEPTSPTQGMVVVPVDDKTNRDATVAKIKDAFSDEVSVKPDQDNASGVITPVFKKTKGDEYLYVLVPIKN